VTDIKMRRCLRGGKELARILMQCSGADTGAHQALALKIHSQKINEQSQMLVRQPSLQTIKNMTDLMFQHVIILQVRIFYYILTIYLLSQTWILSAENSLKTISILHNY
jgi:hypothetical protein